MRSRARRCRKLSEKAFELSRSLLSPEDAERIRADIYDHNEWGLAMETLVDVLLEEEIAVSLDQKRAILDAMDAMGLDRGQSELEVTV